jgi:peptidyl-prolyl cis-trans isomerase D
LAHRVRQSLAWRGRPHVGADENGVLQESRPIRHWRVPLVTLMLGIGPAPSAFGVTMLRDFRKVFKGSKGVTGSLMIVLSVGLLAYLGTSFQTTHPNSPDAVLARVYGREIKRRDLNEAMKRMMQQFGQQDNMDLMLPFIQQQAIGQLMNIKVTEELARRHGVVVTDAELRDALATELKSIPYMLDANGQLLPTAEIRQILAQAFRLSLKDFEDGIRSSLMTTKLREQTAALVPVDEAWLVEENRARSEKISLDYISQMPAAMAVPDPGDEVLDGFLKASGDRFQQGPRRVLQTAAIDQSHFGSSLIPDETVLKDTFEAKKLGNLELKASHILVRGATPEELEAAGAKIAKIRERLVAGADFAKVAADASEDPTAKANSGDLGWFRDGTMDKGFWDGAKALSKGEISQPVKSMYGLHLIKLHDRRERTFEDAKHELTAEIINERFSAKAKEKLEALRKRVGERGDLDAGAKLLGLKTTTSEPFTSDAPVVDGLAGVQNAAQDAFRMKVGQVSQVISAPGRFIVYRVQKELPIAVPPLKEVRAAVLEAYRLEEARRRLLASFGDSGGDLHTLGATQAVNGQTFAEMTDLAENALARKTILETPVGGVTKAVWTNDGKLWMAMIRERSPADQLTTERRMELVKDIQGKDSMKILEAELKDLSAKGAMRRGFSSLWGRINGIYTDDAALKPRAAEVYDDY